MANLASALNTEGISFDVRKGLKEGNQVTFHLENPPVDEEKYETKKLSASDSILNNWRGYFEGG